MMTSPATAGRTHRLRKPGWFSEQRVRAGLRPRYASQRRVLAAVARGSAGVGDLPLFVLASSLAVYGAWPGQAMPEVVTDSTLPTPRSSYGIQKFVVEQLVADYTRKGFVDGRCVRLMTVSVRPGRPNTAASGLGFGGHPAEVRRCRTGGSRRLGEEPLEVVHGRPGGRRVERWRGGVGSTYSVAPVGPRPALARVVARGRWGARQGGRPALCGNCGPWRWHARGG